MNGFDPTIAAALGRMLDDTPPAPTPIAAFDWDETCIRGDISETWLTYLDEQDPGRLAAYEAGCRSDRRAAYEKLAIDLVHGHDDVSVRAAVEASFRRAIREGRIGERPAIRELMAAMASRGWEVWVVTASPTPVVQAVAVGYGVPAERVIGMTSPRGEDGRYRPSLVPPIPYREGKLEALLARTGRPPTFAAGDSEGDLWLLEAAVHALVIDRGDRTDPRLRARAREAGWWVQRGWS
jgi:phosphoserine phosphatase